MKSREIIEYLFEGYKQTYEVKDKNNIPDYVLNNIVSISKVTYLNTKEIINRYKKYLTREQLEKLL